MRHNLDTKYSKEEISYPKVPMTRVDMCLLSSSMAVRAKPKSDTFGVKSSSSKILLALKSLCITRGLESSCRYASPLAAPSAIFMRCTQLSGALSLSIPDSKQNGQKPYVKKNPSTLKNSLRTEQL